MEITDTELFIKKNYRPILNFSANFIKIKKII